MSDAGGAGYRFFGRERVTIELGGWFAPTGVHLPTRLAFELRDGEARLELFAFHVEALRIQGVPLLRATYGELLWRIAVLDAGAPAWWVVACDLGHRGARWAAAQFVRYPVRALDVEVTSTRLEVGGPAGDLDVTLAPAAPAAPTRPAVVAPERRLLVGDAAQWQVPWGDQGTETSAWAPVERVTGSLVGATLGGPVRWDASARVRHGRRHRCGVAAAR